MQKLLTYAWMFGLAGTAACGLFLVTASLSDDAPATYETPHNGRRLVTFEQLPQVVQDGLVKASGNGVIRRIEQRVTNGLTTYEADVDRNGKLFEIKLNATGHVLDIRSERDDSQKDRTVIFEQLPETARTALLQATGNGVIRSIVRTIRDGRIIYVAEIENNDRVMTISIEATNTVSGSPSGYGAGY